MSEQPPTTGRRVPGLALVAGWLLVFGVLSACGGDDPTPAASLSPLAADGQRLVETEGCAACHGGDGRGVVGPALAGLHGTEVELDDGATVVADDDYILRAILDPGAEVRTGFTVVMPVNTLSEDDARAVLAYLKELP